MKGTQVNTVTLARDLVIDAFNAMLSPDNTPGNSRRPDPFGPTPGSIFEQASKEEKRFVRSQEPVLALRERQDFDAYIADHFPGVNLESPDDQKVIAFDSWQIDHGCRNLIKWLSKRTLTEIPNDIIAMIGFSPGIAILAYRDREAMAETMDGFIEAAFQASRVSREQFLELPNDEQREWFTMWRETILCHVRPLSIGLPEHAWGELVLPR